MKRYLVKPGSKVRLQDFDPSDRKGFEDEASGKQEAEAITQSLVGKLGELQELLYADATRSLLIVLQGIDTAGKDGTIRHVMSGVNPQGCRVSSFKIPSSEESSHDFLWRIHRETPPKGYIGIFNRSHYEDVLVTRVHRLISDKTAERRFRQINDFEKLLVQNGTVILKFFLHISKDEQKRRLQERLRDPKKHWKFNINDVRERKSWDDYQGAFEDMMEATSTKHASWIVVPSNHKWYRNLVVGKAIVGTLKDMDLRYPPGPKDIRHGKMKIV